MSDSKELIADQILEKVKEVPPLSFSAVRLIETMGDEDHSLDDVLRVVETDSVLTANVLRVVNSAAFGLLQPISSLARAVAYLGDKLIVGLAIGSCSGHIFDKSLSGYQAEKGELWKHSFKTAIACKAVSEFSNKKISADIAYTAGILHDIGKSILSDFLGGLTDVIIETLEKQEKCDYIQAEREAIGTDHAEVGYLIAKHWNLPDPLCEAIRCHHYPSESAKEHINFVYVVHLGDLIAQMAGSGTGMDTLQYSLDNLYEDYVSIKFQHLEKMIIDVNDSFQKASAAFFS